MNEYEKIARHWLELNGLRLRLLRNDKRIVLRDVGAYSVILLNGKAVAHIKGISEVGK